TVYHDLYLGEKALVERENMGFDLTKSDLCPSFIKDLSENGVGEDPIRDRRGGLRAREEGTSSSPPVECNVRIYECIAFDFNHFIAIQTCELSKEEFNDFLALYPIPPEYGVMLPKSNQTIFDAPNGYVGLYTHSFSLSNLRLPLTKFFCEVLQYFQIHISRLNPFGYAKLTTFAVMCKAYGCEPSVEIFLGFFNLYLGGKWLTFVKSPEKHFPCLFPKVITHIEGWKGRFFFVQSSIVPVEYLQLLLKHNKWDLKSYKDKLPSNIEEDPMFQRLGRYPIKIAFRNFIYAENEEDLSFLHKDPSPGFEPTLKLAKDTADFGGSPKPKVFVVNHGSVATRIKDKRCKTRGGSSKPPVKRKLALGSSSSCATRAKISSSKDDLPFLTVFDDDEVLPDVFELKDVNACHLKIFAITPPAWKDYLDKHLDVKLLDLHDIYYAKQAVVDNVERERAREEECEEIRTKCGATMTDFENNPTMVVMRDKMSTLSTKAKEHKANLDRMILESQKWTGYQVSLSALESKVASLEAEKARLEAVKVADIKEPFDLFKVKGYRPLYKKEHTQAGNELATATFSWLLEFVVNPSAPIKSCYQRSL
ncbi:hypothetical protein Tco_0870139, partial [Tanacetum coccineum]